MPSPRKGDGDIGVSSADIFMNYVGVETNFEAAASTVGETQIMTGLTLQAGTIWLIHEWQIHSAWAFGSLSGIGALYGLSTRQGLTTFPSLVDPGCIDVMELTGDAAPTPANVYRGNPIQNVMRRQFQPALPIVTPRISLYLQESFPGTAFDGQSVDMRIGFTTARLDAESWREVAEVWGQIP